MKPGSVMSIVGLMRLIKFGVTTASECHFAFLQAYWLRKNKTIYSFLIPSVQTPPVHPFCFPFGTASEQGTPDVTFSDYPRATP